MYMHAYTCTCTHTCTLSVCHVQLYVHVHVSPLLCKYERMQRSIIENKHGCYFVGTKQFRKSTRVKNSTLHKVPLHCQYDNCSAFLYSPI